MAGTLKTIRKNHIKIPKGLKGPTEVKVGFPKGKVDGDIIKIAIWNHYGTRGGGWGGPIPARPFLSDSMRDNRKVYKKFMMAQAKKLFRSETSLKVVMIKLGSMGEADIRKSIIDFSSPPNSPVTIAIKGSSNPLVRHGNMNKAVTWDIP